MVLKQSYLTPEQHQQILVLQELADIEEGLDLKLGLDDRPLTDSGYLRHHLMVQNDKVIAYGSIAGFKDIPELCLVVHPDFQRQGYGTQVLNSMQEIVQNRPQALLICERAALKAQAWVQRKELVLQNSEHRQILDLKYFKPVSHALGTLRMRKAAEEDIAALVQGLKDAFAGYNLEPADVLAEMQAETNQFWVLLDGEVVVGGVKLFYTPTRVGIYGLWIAPTEQGKGYGKALMLGVLNHIRKTAELTWLEVSADNHVAKSLYQSLGFKDSVIYDYYNLF